MVDKYHSTQLRLCVEFFLRAYDIDAALLFQLLICSGYRHITIFHTYWYKYMGGFSLACARIYKSMDHT